MNTPIPKAKLQTQSRLSPLWLLPLLAVLISSLMLYSGFSQQGTELKVQFRQGYGLKAGDQVRYRGITVGKVQRVGLSHDLDHINVEIVLSHSAKNIAKENSQFWIVRPQLDLSGATGLETLIGANYVGVLPGTGKVQHDFIGLDAPPLLALMERGGLEIILVAQGRRGLNSGAPVLYRQVPIGKVLSIDLAHDASAVEARVYILPAYTNLIRAESKFWPVSGLEFEGSFTGRISFSMDSLHSLLLGGINLALPTDAGKPVVQGHRFTLHNRAKREWLTWTPYLSLNDKPNKAPQYPQLLPLQLQWRYRSMTHLWLAEDAQRHGWGLPFSGGFIAPADVLQAPENSIEGSVKLRVADTTFPLQTNKSQHFASGIALLHYQHDFPSWDSTRYRWLTQPENTLVVAAASHPSRLVNKEKYQVEDETWKIDPTIPFDHHWHGAVVLAEKDHAVVGMLLVTDAGVLMVRLPAPQELVTTL